MLPVPKPGSGWTDLAACDGLDPSWFYPDDSDDSDEPVDYAALPGFAVCASCDVQFDCLAAALHGWENFGVWGGFSPDARQKVRPLLEAGAITWDELVAALIGLRPAA